MSNFVFNMAGLRELMKTGGMQGALTEAGQAVKNIADGSAVGYDINTHVAPLTAVCTVYTGSFDAIIDNAENNTLLRAAQGAGLSMR